MFYSSGIETQGGFLQVVCVTPYSMLRSIKEKLELVYACHLDDAIFLCFVCILSG